MSADQAQRWPQDPGVIPYSTDQIDPGELAQHSPNMRPRPSQDIPLPLLTPNTLTDELANGGWLRKDEPVGARKPHPDTAMRS